MCRSGEDSAVKRCRYLAGKQFLKSLHGKLVGILKSTVVLKLFLYSIVRQVRRPACRGPHRYPVQACSVPETKMLVLEGQADMAAMSQNVCSLCELGPIHMERSSRVRSRGDRYTHLQWAPI